MMYRILFISILLFPFWVCAQPLNIFQYMAEQDSLTCTLTTDIKFLINKKHIEEYVPSEFSINGKAYPVHIKTRGNSRKSICYVPPFKIKFDKDYLDVEEPNSFKLVNTCKKGKSYEQLLLKEYFTYKLYNLITPKSLQALLINLTYVDNKDKWKPFSQFAVLLEDEESFASRHRGVIYEPKVTFYNRVDTLQLAILTMFEYMIGNTDWALGNQHNCFVVRDTVAGYPFPVAYDFDYAGLVNAPYAVPQKNAPITSVRNRYNRGRCMTEENMQKARELFLSKKEELLAFVESFEHFRKPARKATYNYIESFYNEIENEKSAQRIFCKNCKAYN